MWSVREGKEFLVLLTERFKCEDVEGMNWMGRTEAGGQGEGAGFDLLVNREFL